jgi:hypothetical protein
MAHEITAVSPFGTSETCRNVCDLVVIGGKSGRNADMAISMRMIRRRHSTLATQVPRTCSVHAQVKRISFVRVT